MPLVFDLTADQSAPRGEGDEVVGFDELGGAGIRGLTEILWSREHELIRAIEDDRPPSSKQAAAEVIAAAARARRFEAVGPSGTRAGGRTGFAARAVGRLGRAVPRELAATRRLHAEAVRVATTDFGLPRRAHATGAAAYLRADATIMFKGAYIGGAATHTNGVINGLAENGVATHVYASALPGARGSASETAVRVARINHLVHWLTLLEYSQTIADAVTVKPDFVYQRYTAGSYAGLELARRHGVPLVLEFNGSDVWIAQNWGGKKTHFVQTLLELEKRNLTDASLIVVVSEVLKEQLVDEQGIDPDRVLSNPNGVDMAPLADLVAQPPRQHRVELGQPDVPTVGFIGTFGPWHGVTVLPPMIERVAAARPEVRWLVIGDGPLFGEVQAEIDRRGLAEHVELTGAVRQERAHRLLAACDICVSPHVDNPDGTRFFGSPTKLFEYMGLAKPIVASDLEQIGDVIDHERTGLLVPPGDAAAAADATLRLVGDEELRERLGKAARESAQRHYTWAAHTHRILDALAG